MQWDRLKTFYYVGKYLSFKKASEVIGIAPSAISRSISLLEHQLKTILFRRNHSGIVFTKSGKALFEVAQEVFKNIEKVKNEILEDHEVPKGELRIFATQAIINYYLSPLLPQFIRIYPEINLRIVGVDTVPDFEHGNIDIALCPPLLERQDLIQKHLFTNHVRLYASPKYLEDYGIPHNPQDLDHHKLIGIGDDLHRFHEMNWHLNLGCEENESRNPYMTINTPNGRLMFAEQGFGIAAVAKEHPGIDKMNIVSIMTHLKAPILENYLIYSKHLKTSKRIQAFESFMVPLFQKTYGP